MKYRLVRKNFEDKENIEIPDNAVAIAYAGIVKIRVELVVREWLGIKLAPSEKDVWGHKFEWLEPVEVKQ